MPHTSIAHSFASAAPVAEIARRPRIIARNTFQYTTFDAREVIRLHLTDIAELHSKPHAIVLNSGGYRTVTTKDRINLALSRWGNEYAVYSGRGVWIVSRRQDGVTVPFFDGMKLPAAFDKPSEHKKAEKANAEEMRLRASIKSFVDRTIPTRGDIPQPSNGDCFFCSMFDAEKEARRESNGHTIHTPRERDDSHLREHIREGYLPGWLIVNAFRDRGMADAGIAISLSPEFRRGDNREVRRTVTRYLQKRLGIPYR